MFRIAFRLFRTMFRTIHQRNANNINDVSDVSDVSDLAGAERLCAQCGRPETAADLLLDVSGGGPNGPASPRLYRRLEESGNPGTASEDVMSSQVEIGMPSGDTGKAAGEIKP